MFENAEKEILVNTEKLQRSLCLQFNTECISINVFQSFNQNISSAQRVSLWLYEVWCRKRNQDRPDGKLVWWRWLGDSNKVVQSVSTVIKFVLNRPGQERPRDGRQEILF